VNIQKNKTLQKNNITNIQQIKKNFGLKNKEDDFEKTL